MSLKKSIPWLRLSTEVGAIIFSILAAFAIDAWWDLRRDEARLQGTMRNLQETFSAFLAEVENNIEYIGPDLQTVSRFIELDADEMESIPPELRFNTLVSIWRQATFDLDDGYIVRILDSDELKTLEDEPLQSAFARWQGALETLEEHRAGLTAHYYEAIALLGEYEEIARALGRERDSRTDLGVDVMKSIRRDPRIVAMAARKAQMARVHVSVLSAVRNETALVVKHLQNTLQSMEPE